VNRVVLTLGTFDLMHVGHLELLQASRDLAGDGRVVVGLNTDRFITDYKGRAPIQPYAQREAMLRACRLVDLVVANIGGEDSKPCIEMVHPDLLTIGDDWYQRDYLGQLGVTQAWLDQRKLKIAYIPRTTGESTTRLRTVLGAA
jgi:glycerol-3-phosphate cytidylyltransferase